MPVWADIPNVLFRMVNTTAIEPARLLIDSATFHIDPTFFLRHGVCFVQSFNEKGADVFMAQMINKLWYDQQHRDSSNKNALGGGSVSWKVNNQLVIYLVPNRRFSLAERAHQLFDSCVTVAVELTFDRRVL